MKKIVLAGLVLFLSGAQHVAAMQSQQPEAQNMWITLTTKRDFLSEKQLFNYVSRLIGLDPYKDRVKAFLEKNPNVVVKIQGYRKTKEQEELLNAPRELRERLKPLPAAQLVGLLRSLENTHRDVLLAVIADCPDVLGRLEQYLDQKTNAVTFATQLYKDAPQELERFISRLSMGELK